jgi:MFS family permease
MVKSRLQVYTAVFFLVFLQTYFARFAYFYADDFRVIQNFSTGSNGIFELANGHFAPLTNAIYYLMFATFGLESYTPYLIFAGLINLYFGLSLAEYFLSKNITNKKLILITSLFIVVPFSAHSIFWVASAINLLAPSLLLNLLTHNYLKLNPSPGSRQNFTIMSIGLVLVSIGLGGYGLIIIPSVVILSIVKKNYIGLGVIAGILIPTALIYSNLSTSSYSLLTLKFPEWFFTSVFEFSGTIIPSFPPYNLFSQLVLLFVLVSIGYASIKIVIDFKKSRKVLLDPAIVGTLAMLISTIFLMYRARGGVESFNASRYVVLFNFMFLFLSAACFQYILSKNGKTVFSKAFFERAFAITILIIVVGRFPMWHQSSLDSSFQGQLNRALIVKGLCEKGLAPAEIEKISLSDGLSNFPMSMESKLWDTLKKNNCN